MKKIFIALFFLIIHSSVFSQIEYSTDEIQTVLAKFLIKENEPQIYKKEELKQYIVIEEILYNDQCLKRVFGVYTFYVSTVDPPKKYILIKNGYSYVIIDFSIEDFLNYIFSLDKILINSELLIKYINKIQNQNNLKNKIYEAQIVSSDSSFVHFRTIILNEY